MPVKSQAKAQPTKSQAKIQSVNLEANSVSTNLEPVFNKLIGFEESQKIVSFGQSLFLVCNSFF